MKDELFGNKLAAAGLTVALLFFAPPILVNTFYGGVGHHGGGHGGEHEGEEAGDNPLGLAYPIEFSLEGGGAEAAPEVDLGTLLANASPEAGERATAICHACHTFEKGGANGTGPNLWGVVGADIASHSGFNYSGALAGMEGQWTYEKLDPFLENSQAYVPGTQMAQRIGKEEKRADILAYLATLTDGEPVPFPEPAPVEEPSEEMAAADGEATEGEGEAADGAATPESTEEAAEEAGQVADEVANDPEAPADAETTGDGDTNTGEIEE